MIWPLFILLVNVYFQSNRILVLSFVGNPFNLMKNEHVYISLIYNNYTNFCLTTRTCASAWFANLLKSKNAKN